MIHEVRSVQSLAEGFRVKLLEATEAGFKAGLRLSQPEALQEIERLRGDVKRAREKAESDMTILYGPLLNQVGCAAGVPNIGFKAPEEIAAMTVERIADLGAEVERLRRDLQRQDEAEQEAVLIAAELRVQTAEDQAVDQKLGEKKEEPKPAPGEDMPF